MGLKSETQRCVANFVGEISSGFKVVLGGVNVGLREPIADTLRKQYSLHGIGLVVKNPAYRVIGLFSPVGEKLPPERNFVEIRQCFVYVVRSSRCHCERCEGAEPC